MSSRTRSGHGTREENHPPASSESRESPMGPSTGAQPATATPPMDQFSLNPSVKLSLKPTSEPYEDFLAWQLNFRSALRLRKPALAPMLENGANDADFTREQRLELSAHLVPFLAFDVIKELQRRSFDVELQPIASLNHLINHFKISLPQQNSAEELFLAAIFVRRNDFDTIPEYLQAILEPLATLPSTTHDGRSNYFAEKVLALKVLSDLRNAQWLSSLGAATKRSIRDPPQDGPRFSLRTFVQSVLELCPAIDRRSPRKGQRSDREDRPSVSSVQKSGSRVQLVSRTSPPSRPYVANITADDIPSGEIGVWYD